MPEQHPVDKHVPTFIDVQRRVIFADMVTKDGVPVLSVEKEVPGGSSKRILLLNKVDAQAAIRALENYLKHVYSQEMAGVQASLSPADMVELFGLDDEDEDY